MQTAGEAAFRIPPAFCVVGRNLLQDVKTPGDSAAAEA